jgi:O-antigen ligase
LLSVGGIAAGWVIALGKVTVSLGAIGFAALTVFVFIFLSTFPLDGSIATIRERSLNILLFLYLAPLMMLGRVFALVGHNPVYLPDVLILLAVVLMLSRVSFRSVTPLPLVLTLIAGLALRAVYAGHAAGYKDALKGMVLAYYPLVGLIMAGWIALRDDAEILLQRLAKYVLPLTPIGLLIVIATRVGYVPASYGMYLGIAGAFAVCPAVPRRWLLAVAVFVAATALAAASARRGAALTVVIAPAAAWLAASRSRPRLTTAIALSSLAALIAAVAVTVSTSTIDAVRLPLVGNLVLRSTNGTQNASGNVAIREAMWSYAIHTVASQDPVLGVGAYHPIEVDFEGNDLVSDPADGVHNSFVGYAFYAGFPAAGLVILALALALWRTWRIRASSPYAPALFGGIVGVIVTALTNVTLETTYMGGPSWLLVGAAVGLAGSVDRRQGTLSLRARRDASAREGDAGR